MNKELKALVDNAKHILVIQAENPDGDSLGSALALEQILGELGKEVSLYCPVEMPKYLRYFKGWDRVTTDFPDNFDISLIVDTSAMSLLEKALAGGQRSALTNKPVVFIDHHDSDSTIDFEHLMICDPEKVSTAEIIYDISIELDWPLDAHSSRNLIGAILSDSLGLVSAKTSSHTVKIIADMMQEYDVSIAEIDVARRALGKKSKEILSYKGALLQRISYHLDGKLAILTIPQDEIKEYSDQYNPSVLALEELRSVEGLELSIALKTYNNRITGKLRANDNIQICDKIAEKFGGGGHPYAAGFKTSDWQEPELRAELIKITQELLEESSNADNQ